MKVVLELQDQPTNVRRVTVRHDIVIGRGADCNLRLSAPQISRRHCFLRVGRDGVSVTDLDSSNGTYVNGQRLKAGLRQDLMTGTTLSIGPVHFVVHIREDAVAQDAMKTGSIEKTRSGSPDRFSDSSTMISGAESLLQKQDTHGSTPQSQSDTLTEAIAESQFVTSDPARGEVKPSSDRPRRNAPLPESLDSLAEIVDLGRKIAAMDAAEIAKRAPAGGDPICESAFDTHSSLEADAPPENLSFFDNDDTEPVEVVEEVDVVEEVEAVEPVEVVEEVEAEPFVEEIGEELLVDESDLLVDTEAAESVEIANEVVPAEPTGRPVFTFSDSAGDSSKTTAEVSDPGVKEIEEDDEVLEVFDEPDLLEDVEDVENAESAVVADDTEWDFVDVAEEVEPAIVEVAEIETQNDDDDPELQKFLKGF